MGASFRTHSSALEEALDIVRRLLAGETESSSRRFRVTKRGVALRPAEPVEVCIGASTPPAIDAWHGWRSAESPAPVSPARRRAHRPIFYPSAAPLTAAPSGHRATTGHLRGRVVVEAQKVLRQVLDRGYRGIAEETLIAGSVEEVAEGFGLSRSSAAPRSSCVGAPSGGARGAGLGAPSTDVVDGIEHVLSSEPLPSRGRKPSGR